MGELTLQRADGTTVSASLAGGPVLVGRGAAAPIRILDEFISRAHCEVVIQEARVVLRDLNSHNGTLVNGQRVQEAALASGDRLQLGLTQLSVQISERPAAPGQSASRDLNVVLRVQPTAAPQPNPAETVRISLPPQT